MKKKLILMFLGVFLLCGCEMKEEINFSINEDKSMDLKVITGFDDELIDTMMSMEESNDEDIFGTAEPEDETTDLEETEDEPTEYTDEQRKQYLRENMEFNDLDVSELEAKGFKLEEFQDDKYTGYIITGKVDNIDNLIGTPDFNLDDIGDINNKKMFTKDGNVYTGKILVGDPTDTGDGSTSTSGINLIYNFTLNLPNEAKTHNATTISEDGKTLTWNLANGDVSTINFSFEFPSKLAFLKDNMLLTAGIAVVVVLLIVIVITLVLKKGKNKKDNSLNDVAKVTANEPTMEKTNNVNTIDPTQINQVVNPSIQTQPEQNQTMINQIPEQPQTNINNVVESQNINTQPSIEPTLDINSQPSIQQPIQNQTQEETITAMNNIPVMPTTSIENSGVGTQNSTSEMPQISPVTQPEVQNITSQSIPVQPIEQQPQPVPTMGQAINNQNFTQPSNEIPEIKPVVPEHINVQPMSQPTNTQPGISFVTGETQQNNNINNQGI